MRDIKFRAWDKKMGMMSWGGVQKHTFYDVINAYPDTLMQYTGLKDKNGKEICEGDIVDDGWEVKFGKTAVQWEGEGKYYPLLWYIYKKDNGYERNLYPLEEGCEIKGNLYEDSNLLKDAKK